MLLTSRFFRRWLQVIISSGRPGENVLCDRVGL